MLAGGAALLGGALLPQGREDLGGGEGEVGQADPDGVEHGVGDGRDRGVQRSLAGLLCSVGPLRIEALDDEGVQLGRVDRGRQPVVEQVGAGV